MKKYLSLFLVFLMTLFCFSGCGSQQNTSETASSAAETAASMVTKSDLTNTAKLKIVTTIFPEYDWVKSILGDQTENVELTMLLDNGVDLHSYQPTADDIAKISDCDLFIYVGGESDGWVDDALKNASNKNMKVVNLLDVLGDSIKEEEVVEGMETEAEEEEADGEEEPEYDEHVWLSLKNTKTLCSAIASNLEAIDPDHADIYKTNVSDYIDALTDLDQQYQTAVNDSKHKTLLFGDRFPFRYMVDDYGLNYYAAFVGCSAETEASFETITFLAQKVDELDLKYVMTIEKSDQKIANTIIQNTKDKNQQILTLDSMQSTTSDDVANGTTYLSVMQNNLTVLKQALQ